MSSYRDLLKKFSPVLLGLFLIVVYVAGSQLQARPPKTPAIPSDIKKGERQEPLISVYIAAEDIVQEMPIEDYVAGVVAGEMDPDWPLEALAAQAILARTFTLQKITESGGVPKRNTHASTDIEEFQAYSAERINDKVREAVRLTRGMVACYKNEFIRAWFHAYAGPRTALANEGLAFKYNPPYIYSVEGLGKKIISPEEGNWSAVFDLEQVRNAVLEATGVDPGTVTGVKMQNTVLRPGGYFLVNNQQISGPALRLALGSAEMRSTLVESGAQRGQPADVRHGLRTRCGALPMGARAMAAEGKSTEEIVKYFYKNIRLASLWD